MNKIQIVAECGINHNGSMELARELIKQAQLNGADLVKFQFYDVEKFFPNKEVLTQNKNWYEEVKKTQLTKEQAKMLFNYGEGMGIEVFFSVFDRERVVWCEEIGVKRYKLAKTLNDQMTIRDILATKKPIISSRPYRDPFCSMKILLCVSKYPASITDYQLGKNRFGGFYDGISDHTIGLETSMIAMARGAKIVEKHFCLKRDNSNPDMILSIEPYELKQLVAFARVVELMEVK